MSRPRVLVSWVGHADLRGFASELPPGERDALLKVVGTSPAEGPGPIKTLLNAEHFDEVHLLSNYGSRWDRPYGSGLGCKPKIHRVELHNPTDYAKIFEIVNQELPAILAGRSVELNIHLSPGTPAMTAIWLLLGKTRFPAAFYQTHKGRAWKTEIPFDIAVDFVPELLKAPDTHLQHLAAQSPGEVQGFQHVVGDSHAIRLAVGRARRAALRHVSVLLVGESGTGKEMFARAIHAASARREKPFVAINCAAIPRELLESELFGYVKGAFTGANQNKRGLFELANTGTIFLDEISEMSLSMQVKLLRVLQERLVRPVGGGLETPIDVRVIAATNKDLDALVGEGLFREDLYYRLRVIPIDVPPLRERGADVVLLANFFLKKFAHQMSKNVTELSPESLDLLRGYDWPGNVRVLENTIERAVAMADGDPLQVELPNERSKARAAAAAASAGGATGVALPADGMDMERYIADVERSLLQSALRRSQGVQTRAAEMLKLSYRSFRHMMKKYDL